MSTTKITDPDTFRKNIVKKLEVKIGDHTKSINLEKAIFNSILKEASQNKVLKKWENTSFVLLYTNKLRSVYLNLTPDILDKLQNNSIKSHQIPFMTHQELNPDRWSGLIEMKIKRDKSKFETNIEAATDTFQCRKCKTNKCTYYQMQTRSADEPMTTFVTCLNCDNRWKC
uniref:TFIIS-type domain-containing protein n=1 Tax=viral metagenome TaxID=1070528 RepID=A0A6C0LKA2_9ZZZZ